MLEVTSEAQETALQVNFAEIYKNSDLYRYVLVKFKSQMHMALTPSITFVVDYKTAQFTCTQEKQGHDQRSEYCSTRFS